MSEGPDPPVDWLHLARIAAVIQALRCTRPRSSLEIWLNPDDEISTCTSIFGYQVQRSRGVPPGGVRLFDRDRMEYVP